MRASISGMVAAALAGMALAGPAIAQQSGEGRSGPLVLQLDPAAADRGADVKVIRGSGSATQPVSARPATAAKAVPSGGVELAGGDTLWLVDRKAGRLTGCFLAATIVAGDLRDIRCETRRLP